MNAGQRSIIPVLRLGVFTAFVAIAASIVEYWPQESSIPWRTFSGALQEAEISGKPIFLDLYAAWCGPCKQMDRETFPDDSVREILTSRYIPARVDIDTPVFSDSLKKAWNLKGVPTSMILSWRGDEWRRRVGFQTAKELMGWLSDTTLTTTSGWREFDKARIRARETNRPMLLVVAANGEQVEHVEEFFADSTMRMFVARTFEPTLIIQNGPSGMWIDTLRALTPMTMVPSQGFLLITLMPDGRDLGQLPLFPMDLGDGPKVRQTLERFVKR